jgi:hypothetical protein
VAFIFLHSLSPATHPRCLNNAGLNLPKQTDWPTEADYLADKSSTWPSPVLPEIPLAPPIVKIFYAEDGQLLPLSDTSSALVIPDAKRPPWSVRHAQVAGHEIVLGAKPGLLLQGNPRYFVPFNNCPETVLWLIRL